MLLAGLFRFPISSSLASRVKLFFFRPFALALARMLKLAELALDKTAATIGRIGSLTGLPEELALALFELVLAKGKLTERSLKLFLDLVKVRARKVGKAEGGGGGGVLFPAAATASFDDDDDDNNSAILYSSLARRIASLRLQRPPPVVPVGTGRWLGDLPPPWK